MELKLKYQYTYFIKPFMIEENKYESYIQSLLNNKNCKLKIFEKERDFNIYSYFIQNVREYFFPTFLFDRRAINNYEKLSNKMKSVILSKFHCNIFEYNFKEDVQGKINEDEGIFFNIDKIEIVCFDTGICFLIIKTDIVNSEKFSDLLNFNYRFKDINSNYSKLKNFTNITIQTDKFANMSKLSKFINDITEIKNNKLKDIDLYNEKFFVYTYSCIDQEAWNTEEDFETLESEFLKYTNLNSSSNTQEFNSTKSNKSTKVAKELKYARFGFTKQSASLMASNIDINNYTKLPFEYENEYLYTLIISLYQRIYLKKMERDFKNKKDIKKVRQRFTKFTNEIWRDEITNSAIGTTFYNKWKETFELQKIYDSIKNKYEVLYKELNIEKENKTNKVIMMALIISLLFNIINFIAMMKLW